MRDRRILRDKLPKGRIVLLYDNFETYFSDAIPYDSYYLQYTNNSEEY